MKEKIAVVTMICGLSMLALAEGNGASPSGNGGGSSSSTPAPAGNLAIATNSSAYRPTLTHSLPGFTNLSVTNVTNGALGNSVPTNNGIAGGYIPPGYANPYANYTNPYWKGVNTNGTPNEINSYATNNWINTNAYGLGNTNSSSAGARSHHWWKFW